MISSAFRKANKPEPIEKVDTTGLVKWGEDNLYPQFLVGLMYDNSIHGGIVNQKYNFITAGGIDTELTDKTILEGLQSKLNNLVKDTEIGDTWALLWRKNKATNQWNPTHVDFELIRATENGVFFHYSENWATTQQNEKTGFKVIKSIKHITPEDDECIQVQITRPKQRLFEADDRRKKQLTASYYPIVNYSGAITDILALIEMSFFQYAEVVNSYKGGTLINLANGIPPLEEDRRRLEDGIKAMATDRNIQAGIAFTYSDGKEREPTIHQINGTDLDKRYLPAKEAARDSILVAHQVISPTLFGVFTGSMFGSKEEMLTAYELFKSNYVVSRQLNVSEPFNWAYEKLNGVNPMIFFNEYSPSFATEINEAKTQQFSSNKENEIIELFKSCGRNKADFVIKKSFIYDKYEDNESEIKQAFLNGNFADSLTDVQRIIVTMIKDGESYDAILKATELTQRQLSNQLNTLANLNYISKDWKVTEKGNNSTLTESQIEVVYSYEVKANAPALKGVSREFCARLIELDRVYTRAEIERISTAIGRDVWRYRGGWYHNPNTGKNTPSCRHTWMQNVTINI